MPTLDKLMSQDHDPFHAGGCRMSMVAFLGALTGTMIDPLTWLPPLAVIYLVKVKGLPATLLISCGVVFALGALISVAFPNPIRDSFGKAMVFSLIATAIWTVAFFFFAAWRRKSANRA